MTPHLRFTLAILSLTLSTAALHAETSSANPASTVVFAFATSTTDAGTDDTDAGLLKMIQVELERVGYDPGNTDGVMDKLTIVAITRFQASKGMEITGQPSPQLAGILQAEQAGASSSSEPSAASSNIEASDASPSNGLSVSYLNGHWCTERTQERALYNFAADGSYRLGVAGLTITQFGGVNYFPETRSRQSFLDSFSSVTRQDPDRFTVILRNGSKETFIRGNCFE